MLLTVWFHVQLTPYSHNNVKQFTKTKELIKNEGRRSEPSPGCVEVVVDTAGVVVVVVSAVKISNMSII